MRYVIIWGTFILLLHSGCTKLHSHSQCIMVPFSLKNFQYLSLIIAILRSMWWYLIVVLIYVSLLVDDDEHLFMYLCLLESWILLLLFSCMNSSYVLDTSALLDIWFAGIISYSAGWILVWLTLYSAVLKLFDVVLFIFAFVAITFESDPKISLRVTKRNIVTMCSSRSFMVSDLTFKSLIHFELIFVYGVR